MYEKIKVSAEALEEFIKVVLGQSTTRLGELLVVHNLQSKMGGDEYENPLTTLLREMEDPGNRCVDVDRLGMDPCVFLWKLTYVDKEDCKYKVFRTYAFDKQQAYKLFESAVDPDRVSSVSHTKHKIKREGK